MVDVMYLGVTADKYEFPIYYEDSLWELAEYTGIKKQTIASYITKGYDGRKIGIKFLKVIFDEE